MVRIDGFKLVIEYLKDGAIITNNGKNEFYLNDGKVIIHFNGSLVKLSLNDFMDLYHNDSFYLLEEEVVVDETKDEDYYRYYCKWFTNIYEIKIGSLLLQENNDYLIKASFNATRRGNVFQETPLLKETIFQIHEYLEGEKVFELNIKY